MFVACNTLCFAQDPMESALRQIVELEFDKFELALVEGGKHLQLSEAGDDPDAAAARLRQGPSLVPSSLYTDFGATDWSEKVTLERFEGICRLAKSLSVAVITMHAAPRGTAIDQEVKRLSSLGNNAFRKGLVLALLTHSETLTADPQVAVELCQAVPGLGLALDPSHFLQGPKPDVDFDCVFPYVQSVNLRDTGTAPGEFQVRVGQGKVDYARIVNMLQRHGYNRALTVTIVDRPDNQFDREVEVRKLKLLLETLI
jgi:sugar phosphate isomerase/epimerase